ncbi:hypothetical protein GCM10027341_39970 [Spirosoma knui]
MSHARYTDESPPLLNAAHRYAGASHATAPGGDLFGVERLAKGNPKTNPVDTFATNSTPTNDERGSYAKQRARYAAAWYD